MTKLTLDAPKNVEAVQFLHDLIWKHQVSPTGNEQRGGLSREDAFIQGKTSITFDATQSGANFMTKGCPLGLDWDLLPLVKGPGGYGGRTSMDANMGNRKTKYPDHAWIVLQESVSKETMEYRAEKSRQQPARKSASPAWERNFTGKNVKLGKLMSETAKADPIAFWKDAVDVGTLAENHLSRGMIRNEATVAQVLKQAQDEAKARYGLK